MAKAERVFNIMSQSTYHIVIDEVENLEDVDEEFITFDELKEMGFDKNRLSYLHGYTTLVLDKKVKSALNVLKRAITKSGNKSVKIDDEELIEMFTSSEKFVSEFVDGLRRVGNRLSLTPKKAEQTKVKKQDYSRLVNFSISYMRAQLAGVLENSYGVQFDVTHAYNNRPAVIKMFKKLMTWDEFKTFSKKKFSNTDDDLKWVKMLWDDPTLLEEEVKK